MNRTYFFILAAGATIACMAQGRYFPDGTRWVERDYFSDYADESDSHYAVDTYDTFVVSGDTTVNGVTWKKVIQSTYIGHQLFSSEASYLIREDDDIVYRRWQNAEIQIYDFDWREGKTIPFRSYTGQTVSFTYLAENSHQEVLADGNSYDVWAGMIHSIGNKRSILRHDDQYAMTSDCGCDHSLTYFERDGHVLYEIKFDESGKAMNLNNDIMTDGDVSLKRYSDGALCVYSGITPIARAEVYDAAGHCLYASTANGISTDICIPTLPNQGIAFVRVILVGGNVVSFRITL